ncbi:hypothetical protein KIH87_19070 [Paraneptunicella aestuarii]|uniref:hypothetical protein n=1 Tax=Paraneptunicella aestuarii TaxID=2831148 RepID=UPI001E3245F5|nr:hypothetical protein [Paraneptunicella aestuarii]UAA38734.1 hypothetical protein KIH87_19070 [Paraneptunicella aestuarii]
MNSSIKLLLASSLMLTSYAGFALPNTAECIDINASEITNDINNAIDSQLPYKLSGCFNLNSSVIIKLDNADIANKRYSIDLDLSNATFIVNYGTENPFPVISLQGQTYNGDNIPIESSYIKFPKIYNMTSYNEDDVRRCHYVSRIQNGDLHPSPGIYEKSIPADSATRSDHTQNIGIEIQAGRALQTSLNEISGFCIGLAMVPADTCSDYTPSTSNDYCSYESIVAYNSFFGGQFTNNYADIAISSKNNYGWVNQNNFFSPTFVGDSNNPYCKEYVETDKDQQCKDIFIDGKSAESIYKIDPPNNNSFFEPTFGDAVAKADNFYSRAGNHNMVYKAHTVNNAPVKTNIGNKRASTKVLLYGEVPIQGDENCKGHNSEYYCTASGKKIEAGAVKRIDEDTLPDLNQ